VGTVDGQAQRSASAPHTPSQIGSAARRCKAPSTSWPYPVGGPREAAASQPLNPQPPANWRRPWSWRPRRSGPHPPARQRHLQQRQIEM